MRVIIDIPKEKMQSYGMMYKTFASEDLPNDFDEVVEKTLELESVTIDVKAFGENARQIEFGLAIAAFGQIGINGGKQDKRKE